MKSEFSFYFSVSWKWETLQKAHWRMSVKLESIIVGKVVSYERNNFINNSFIGFGFLILVISSENSNTFSKMTKKHDLNVCFFNTLDSLFFFFLWRQRCRFDGQQNIIVGQSVLFTFLYFSLNNNWLNNTGFVSRKGHKWFLKKM